MVFKLKDDSLTIVYIDSNFDKSIWFWDALQAMVNDSSPGVTHIHEFLDYWMPLLFSSIQNPVSLANKDQMRELNDLLVEMSQLCDEMGQSHSCTDSVLNISNKILARRSRMSDVLDHQLLLCKVNDNEEDSNKTHEEVDEEGDIDSNEGDSNEEDIDSNEERQL